MSVFDYTFDSDIIDELNYRRHTNVAQSVYTPFIRCTSMVSGGPKNLRGFTLGLPNTPDNIASDLFSYLYNPVNDNENVVGVTYRQGSTPELVTIDSEVNNIPVPGITDVTISTLYNGGFTFLATVKLKYYTQNQYDFLYQTFLRPGQHMIIEFGQIRNNNDINDEYSFTPLNFHAPNVFDELSSMLFGYPRITNNKLLELRTPIYDFVVGTVTNFKITSNVNDEYEAELEIRGVSELAYTFSNKESSVVTNSEFSSTSISALFGEVEEKVSVNSSWVYQLVVKDQESVEWNRHILELNEKSWFFGMNKAGTGVLYLSLYYIFAKLLPNIIDKVGSCSSNSDNSDNLRMDVLNKLKIDRSILDKINVGWYEYIRTSRPDLCYINNKNIYFDANGILQPRETDNATAGWFQRFRGGKYSDKRYNPEEYFRIDPRYAYDNQLYDGLGHLGGIYISLSALRDAFLKTDSYGEAVSTILRYVGQSTRNILDLRLKYIEELQLGGELIKDTYFIYNENQKANEPNQDPPPYKFNEFISDAHGSELIDINFDFSLSERVTAALLIGNKLKNTEADKITAMSSPNEIALISSGYDNSYGSLSDNLASLVTSSTDPLSPCVEPVNPGGTENISGGRTSGQIGGTQGAGKGTARKNSDPKQPAIYKNILGHIEFLPEEMKVDAISKSGLYQTLPTSAKIDIQLNGISKLKFGQLFRVNKVLPKIYDSGLFMTIGFSHTISPSGWLTNIEGQFIGKRTEPGTLAEDATELARQNVRGVSGHHVGGIFSGGAPTSNPLIDSSASEPTGILRAHVGSPEYFANAGRIHRFFKNGICSPDGNSLHFSDKMIAGIIGNWAWESGLNPKASNPKGQGPRPGHNAYGLAQWRGPRLQELIDTYPDTYDTLDSQLRFACKEIRYGAGLPNGGPRVHTELTTAATFGGVEAATISFEKSFERSKHISSYPRRVSLANDFYSLLQQGEDFNE